MSLSVVSFLCSFAEKQRCVYIQNAHVCAVKTPLCHITQGRFDGTHGGVSKVRTGASRAEGLSVCLSLSLFSYVSLCSSLSRSLSLTHTLTHTLSLLLSLTLLLSYSHTLILSYSHTLILSYSVGRDMRSTQSRGHVRCQETSTAVSLKEQKKPTLSLEPRDFDTRVRTKSATRSKKGSLTSSLPESPDDAKTRSCVFRSTLTGGVELVELHRELHQLTSRPRQRQSPPATTLRTPNATRSTFLSFSTGGLHPALH